jgi:hypothetical protein
VRRKALVLLVCALGIGVGAGFAIAGNGNSKPQTPVALTGKLVLASGGTCQSPAFNNCSPSEVTLGGGATLISIPQVGDLVVRNCFTYLDDSGSPVWVQGELDYVNTSTRTELFGQGPVAPGGVYEGVLSVQQPTGVHDPQDPTWWGAHFMVWIEGSTGGPVATIDAVGHGGCGFQAQAIVTSAGDSKKNSD